MPLLDHFHPPLAPERKWESFHAFWAIKIAENLNSTHLPERYFAEAQVHVGPRVEVDIATLESQRSQATAWDEGGVAVETWVPPVATLAMPAVFPEEVEIQIFHDSGGAILVGAIELISPSNKDRPEARRGFAGKCASYLQEGIGLVIIDVVTERNANLHDELIRLMEQDDRYLFPHDSLLYAVAYHPLRREPGGDQIDIWPAPLTLGQPLPTLPLALRGGPIVKLDLDITYSEARLKSRL
jgi:hypothetical protein